MDGAYLGIGGAGGRVVQQLATRNEEATCHVADTDGDDLKSLTAIPEEKRTHLDVDDAEAALAASVVDSTNPDVVAVVFAPGGKTGGSVGAAVLDQLASYDIPVVAFSILPARSEGKDILLRAQTASTAAQHAATALLCVSNGALLSRPDVDDINTVLGEQLDVFDAFVDNLTAWPDEATGICALGSDHQPAENPTDAARKAVRGAVIETPALDFDPRTANGAIVNLSGPGAVGEPATREEVHRYMRINGEVSLLATEGSPMQVRATVLLTDIQDVSTLVDLSMEVNDHFQENGAPGVVVESMSDVTAYEDWDERGLF